jgi:hypothetical protein
MDNNYSGARTIELTAKGWLYLAQIALEAADRVPDQKQRLQKVAETRIRVALADLEANRKLSQAR